MANSQIGALSVKITADSSNFEKGMKRTGKSLAANEKQLKQNAKAHKDWANSLNLSTVAMTAAFGMAAGKAISYADTFTSITNKLKLATKDTEQLTIVTDALFASASNTGTAVDSTVELYAKLERSTRELNISQDRLLDITGSINKAFAIGGASTQEAAGSIRQLGQALASGALRGDEFNSIAEQAPIIMEAVSKATGKNAGELRKLAGEGLITADILIKSLEAYKGKIDGDYSTAQKTYAQKMEASTNALIKFVGESDGVTSAVDALGDGILGLANNLDIIGDVINTVLILAIGKYVGALTTATAANVGLAASQLATAKTTKVSGSYLTGYSVATRGATVATTGLTAATGLLKTSMAFLGGPVGVAIIAALALYQFIDSSDDTAVSAKLTTAEVDKLKESFKALSESNRKLKLQEVADEIKLSQLAIEKLNTQLEQTKLLLKSSDPRTFKIAQQNADNYVNQIKTLNTELDRLKAKQEVLDPKAKPKSDTDGKVKPIIDLEAGAKLKADKKAAEAKAALEAKKLAAQKEAAVAYLEVIKDRFKTEEQLENDRYAKELKITELAFSDKNANQAEQNEIEADMLAEHEMRLANIKAENIPVDTSIGILEALGLQYQTEEEMLLASLIRKQEILKEAHENKKITDEEYNTQSVALTQASEEAKRKITLDNVQQGLQGLISNSKKAQKVMKAAAIVQAVMKGKTAAVSAWEAGMSTGGPWAPAVAAAYTAASIANTASQIQAIRSGGSSMGGSAKAAIPSSSSSGSSASTSQAQDTTPRAISINMTGQSMFSTDQVRELISQINDQVGDGVTLATGA